MPRQKLSRVRQYEFAEHANTANTAHYTSTTPTAIHATLTGHANTATFAENASFANNVGFANAVNAAASANSAEHATTVTFAEHANTANTANTATNATHANNADNATNANNTAFFAGHSVAELMTSASQILRKSVTYNVSQLNVCYATPQLFLAGAAGQTYFILNIAFIGIGWSFGTIKSLALQYDSTGNAGGTLAGQGGVTFGGNIDPTPQNSFQSLRPYSYTGNTSLFTGKGLYLANEVSIDGGVRAGSQVEVIIEYLSLTI